MKTFLLAMTALVALAGGSAVAADMPVKALPVATAYNWTGFYLGANGGYSWGRSDSDVAFKDSTTGATFATVSNNLKLKGGVFGLHAGYNWQINWAVFGAETDIQWTGERGSGSFVCPTACSPNGAVTAILDPKLTWFGTLRNRVGITASSFLAYVTGGLAYGGIKSDGTFSGFNIAAQPVSGNLQLPSSTRVGWTIGAGIETVLAGNWTAKIEYLHVDLGSFTVVSPVVAGGFSFKIADDIVRIGVNYQLR